MTDKTATLLSLFPGDISRTHEQYQTIKTGRAPSLTQDVFIANILRGVQQHSHAHLGKAALLLSADKAIPQKEGMTFLDTAITTTTAAIFSYVVGVLHSDDVPERIDDITATTWKYMDKEPSNNIDTKALATLEALEEDTNERIFTESEIQAELRAMADGCGGACTI